MKLSTEGKTTQENNQFSTDSETTQETNQQNLEPTSSNNNEKVNMVKFLIRISFVTILGIFITLCIWHILRILQRLLVKYDRHTFGLEED